MLAWGQEHLDWGIDIVVKTLGPILSCKAVCLHFGFCSLQGACLHAGIGLPAVAASGAITANSMVPIWDHLRMLDSIKA